MVVTAVGGKRTGAACAAAPAEVSPHEGNAVRAERSVSTDQVEPLDSSLGKKESIKWIAMVPRK